MKIKIALDAMGGDFGPSVVVPAALDAIKRHPNLSLILVGDHAILAQCFEKHGIEASEDFSIHHASQSVGMDEPPADALRYKKDSSMRVALNLVKAGEAHACVSAGNTGALVASARFVLKMLPGVNRPAILATFPTIDPNKSVRIVDLGANVDSSPEHLLQFAVMGSIVAEAVEGIKSPKIALLNIGAEAIKGNQLVKETGKLLAEQSFLNYIGFVEGDDLNKGVADVIVCDGFVGNVALKATEGIAKLIARFMKEAFNKNGLTRFVGLLALPIIKSLKKRIDPARYNGASFLGLTGIVIKSHGGASALGFSNAIHEAVLEVEKNIPRQIGERVSQILEGKE